MIFFQLLPKAHQGRCLVKQTMAADTGVPIESRARQCWSGAAGHGTRWAPIFAAGIPSPFNGTAAISPFVALGARREPARSNVTEQRPDALLNKKSTRSGRHLDALGPSAAGGGTRCTRTAPLPLFGHEFERKFRPALPARSGLAAQGNGATQAAVGGVTRARSWARRDLAGFSGTPPANTVDLGTHGNFRGRGSGASRHRKRRGSLQSETCNNWGPQANEKQAASFSRDCKKPPPISGFFFFFFFCFFFMFSPSRHIRDRPSEFGGPAESRALSR